MPSIESFETKRGVARFTDAAVHFDESLTGYVRSLYDDYWQSEVWWLKVMFIGYAFALLYALWWGITEVRSRDVFLLAAVVGLLGALWLLNYVRGFRSPDRISLEAIEVVTATCGSKGLTRPRLVIHYRDDSSTHKRRVNLPSLYTENGEETYERACKAFEKRGFELEKSP
ncbi:hypothetical protein [Halospeciosus flavus]|uniref:Uncharacterized protein n=1 Tax=Halospeciosus flavus TaxID=3032283 RepID=A0ABD5Z389_9EURY|nr:hypothetical protein [Halospeciosus flavus]